MTARIEMVSLPVAAPGEHLNTSTIALSRRKHYLIGISLLFVVVILWTTSNFVTQALFDGGYHKPFLVTYLNTSSFTLYLCPFFVSYLWRRKYRKADDLPDVSGHYYEALAASEHEALQNPPLYTTRAPFVPSDAPSHQIVDSAQLPPLTTAQTARLASIFCFFWFVANWSVNASLDYTSVASSTILSSTSGFFTLAIGWLFGVESLTHAKITAVAISFLGILFVSLSDNSSTVTTAFASNSGVPLRVYANPVLGDIWALLAAIFYAFYVILLKIRIRSESRIGMQLFFGFVGLFNILALFPIGLLLHFGGLESFELPSTGKSWGAVLVNMFITLSSDYLYVIAMLRTTPLVVTIGLSLTIPLAVVGDEILNKPTKVQAVLGALLVLGGFGLVGWENHECGSQNQVDLSENGHAGVERSVEVSPDA